MSGYLFCLGDANLDIPLKPVSASQTEAACGYFPARSGVFASPCPGGAVFNTACTAARLGASTAFAGCIGDEAIAVVIPDALERAGVSADGMIIRHADTLRVICVLDQNGDRSLRPVDGRLRASDLFEQENLNEELIRGTSAFLPPAFNWLQSRCAALH